jgi:ParB/RepB/Spo0J family partition protein
MSTQTKKVALSSIIPDPEQPRKNFDATRLAQLIKSIGKHGIMNPLVVEDMGNGKYMLVDGERRYRASKEMKLKEVPVTIIKNQGAVERLIRQFHLQEQHEGWSAIEKAKGVLRLSKELKKDVVGVGEILSLPDRTVRDYMAYGELIATKEFDKSEMPLHYAHRIVSLRKTVRRHFEAHDLEFTRDDEERLEHAVISRAKKGDIKNAAELVKIADASKSNPKSIRDFMKGTMSIQKLFLESNAKLARSYRNTMYSVRYIHAHIKAGMGLGMHKLITDKDRAEMQRAIKDMTALLGK